MIPLFRVAMAQDQSLVETTLQSGFIGQGPRVDQFEEALQDVLQVEDRPVTVNSCTSALDLALHLIGVRRGDVVISTPQTCLATNTVLHQRGAQIVWADIDPLTGNVDPLDVARKVDHHNPKAIMVVDWAGQPCDYATLQRLGPPVIQDAAHAFLGEVGGDYVCYSFQAIKHLTTGDGGALYCRNKLEAARARLLRWYGLDRTTGSAMRCVQDMQEVGYKYHMNDIAAAIGLSNLTLAKANVAKHWTHAAYLRANLKRDFTCSFSASQIPFPCWIMTIHTDRRDELLQYCTARGIGASQVHVRNDTQRLFQRYRTDYLPGVEQFSATQLSIPCGWWLSGQDLDMILTTLNGF